VAVDWHSSFDGAGSSGGRGAVLESPYPASPATQHHICDSAGVGDCGSICEPDLAGQYKRAVAGGNKPPQAGGNSAAHGRAIDGSWLADHGWA